MDPKDCLPAALQAPTTTITKIAAGLSGAGVYRVEAGGESFVLKIESAAEPLDAWRRKRTVQHLAAQAGVAPRVVHTDEERRAVVSAFVADRSFPMLFGTPQTREAAIALLGRTLRRIHDLAIPADAVPRDSLAFLELIYGTLAGFALPAFVREAVERIRVEVAPPSDRPTVLSHNDVNPTNLVYDGETLLLLDWDTAAPNDAYFDLAAIAVFLRMDEATCRALFAAYDGAPIPELPARFCYDRRFVATLCGVAFLHLAHVGGHTGASGETLETTERLADFYQKLRMGQVQVGAPAGQWSFGLSLIKESYAL